MKHIVYTVSFILTVLLTCCEVKIDNYDEPNSGINGTVTDITTGKGLITEEPEGFRIRYRELDVRYPNAPYRDFWGKADGTFTNTKMFAVTYEVYPYDGAFTFYSIEKEKITLEPGEQKTINFSVTPFVTISDFDVRKENDDSVSITFKLKRNVNIIRDYRIFATNRTPLVGTNATDNIGGEAVVLNESDLDASGYITIETGIKGFDHKTGNKYWFRVGARCNDSPSGRYNMSEIKEIQF